MTTSPVPLETPFLLDDEALELAALLSQIRWFNRLRLIVAASVIWLTALAAHAFGIVADPGPLYALGGAIAAIDCLYLALYRRLLARPLVVVRRHVYMQIGVDLALLTALLHFSGGVTNPLALFYLFHAFIAALVLSVRAAVAVGGSSLLLLTALTVAERSGWIEHHPLRLSWLDLHRAEPVGLLLLWFAYAATLAISIYFVAVVLDRLRGREQQLVRLSRHLATNEKLASVGTLAAGVSHEINNPIGVITNKVEILRYRVQDGDPAEKLFAELEVIEKHVRRIAQITDGLLTFSRDVPFELQPLDVPALLREAADLVRVPFRSAGVELACDPSAAPSVVAMGSANHLLQVMINILLNAKDASVRGGCVQLDASVAGDELHLRVRDRGTGIPEDVREKVFDPFFTTKDVDKGTGLGLAISHGIVERHGGRIEVDSAPGEGTEFRVVLPMASPNS